MPFDNPPQPRQEIILLRAARERINNPLRWAQGCWIKPPVGACAIQALRTVCTKNTMVRTLARVLARELPRRYRVLFFLPARTRVILYNDRKHTTHQMVMELFDAAIMRLELESV